MKDERYREHRYLHCSRRSTTSLAEFFLMTKLFTSGYEQHATPAELISALNAAGVRRLVDVRELPLSRRQGFSKRALAAHLEEAGVRYDHARPLGNPKPYRDLYRSGKQGKGEKGYLAHLQNGSAVAVDELAEQLADLPTCLLCFEASHTACHRLLIVGELKKRLPDLVVEHL
jgi:uncharacterized protein (DUF488 family)